jgi:hypothetical protein
MLRLGCWKIFEAILYFFGELIIHANKNQQSKKLLSSPLRPAPSFVIARKNRSCQTLRCRFNDTARRDESHTLQVYGTNIPHSGTFLGSYESSEFS